MKNQSITPVYDRAMHLTKLRRKGFADIDAMALPDLVKLIGMMKTAEAQLTEIRQRAMRGFDGVVSELKEARFTTLAARP